MNIPPNSVPRCPISSQSPPQIRSVSPLSSHRHKTAQYISPHFRTAKHVRAAAAVREAAADSAHLNSLDTCNGRLGATQKQESTSNGAAENEESAAVLSYAPEEFTLAPGEASHIDRSMAADPADAFRCVGCSEPACQVPLLFISLRASRRVDRLSPPARCCPLSS
jgi:hypothetical protein